MLRIAALVAVAIAVLVVSSGIATRASNSRHLRQLTTAQAQPVVTVTAPQRGTTSYAMELPGRLQAYSRAPIYARVNGYLKSWSVDIGSSVQAGQTYFYVTTAVDGAGKESTFSNQTQAVIPTP